MINLPIPDNAKEIYSLIKSTYKRRLGDMTVKSSAIPDCGDLIKICFAMIALRM